MRPSNPGQINFTARPGSLCATTNWMLPISLPRGTDSIPIQATTISGRNPLAGAKVENLSPAAALDLQMDLLSKGVVIVSVNAQSYSGNVGFEPGDIIKSVNGTAINRVGDLDRALNGANHWDLAFDRGGRQLTLSIDG